MADTNTNTSTGTGEAWQSSVLTMLSEIVGSLQKAPDEQTNFGNANKKLIDGLREFGDNLNATGKMISGAVGKDRLMSYLTPSTENSTVLNSIKLAGQGLLQTESKMAGLFNSARTGAVLGGAVGAVGGAALLAAAYATKAVLEQGFTMLKENLSPTLMARNFATSLRTEFTLGNIRSGDQRQFGLTEFTWYRNNMRQLGVREEKEIAQALQKAVEQGIAGGPSRADAVVSTLSSTAIQKTLGIDMSRSMGALYRSTQGNREMFSNAYGDFDLQRFAQNFAYLAKASENAQGVQVSIKDWYSIFDSLKDKFRGTNNDFGVFQRGLSRVSAALTSNEATISDINSLYQASAAGLSDQSIFKMLAFSGTGGQDLLSGRLQFIRRGLSTDVGENARQIAQYMLTYGNRLGGSDVAKRDYFMRNELTRMGMGTMTRSVADLDSFFSKIVRGDSKEAEEFNKLSKDTNMHLMEQAKKLDALRNPVEHIRDLLFGYINIKWFTRSAEAIMKIGTEHFAGKEGTEDYSEKVRKQQQDDLRNGLAELNSTLNGIRQDANAHAAGNQAATAQVVSAIENTQQNVALGEEH